MLVWRLQHSSLIPFRWFPFIGFKRVALMAILPTLCRSHFHTYLHGLHVKKTRIAPLLELEKYCNLRLEDARHFAIGTKIDA